MSEAPKGAEVRSLEGGVPHMPKRCPKCKYFNNDDATSCSLCSEVLPLRASDAVDVSEGRQLRGGKAVKRHTRHSDDRRHYLVTPSAPYIELEAGPRFVIGRDSRASLVISAEDVSRQHAEIMWNGDPKMPSIRDIDSVNGCFVNGKRVGKEERELRHKDLIRLAGSVVLSYRFCRPHELDKELAGEQRDDDTQKVRLPAELKGGAAETSGGARPGPSGARPGFSGGAIAGDFSTLSAKRLLLLLEMLEASGKVEIELRGASGLVEVQGGRPTRVEWAGAKGVAAIVVLSDLAEGQFSFVPAG